MKKIDMKLLRKSAALLLLVALPVVATPAHAQGTDAYKVVINHEEQYSIWPIDRETPRNWEDSGMSGTRQECFDYIKEVWTDMRPLSLRKKLEDHRINPKETPYKVVVNHEEQYSIWLIGQEVTGKWRDTGEVCSLKDCMSYIEGVWTDMRPLNLRQKNE